MAVKQQPGLSAMRRRRGRLAGVFLPDASATAGYIS